MSCNNILATILLQFYIQEYLETKILIMKISMIVKVVLNLITKILIMKISLTIGQIKLYLMCITSSKINDNLPKKKNCNIRI